MKTEIKFECKKCKTVNIFFIHLGTTRPKTFNLKCKNEDCKKIHTIEIQNQ